jgi:hypothetical protein
MKVVLDNGIPLYEPYSCKKKFHIAHCNLKLHANFQRDLLMLKEFIVGPFFGVTVKMGRSPMNKGLMDNSIESFMQR